MWNETTEFWMLKDTYHCLVDQFFVFVSQKSQYTVVEAESYEVEVTSCLQPFSTENLKLGPRVVNRIFFWSEDGKHVAFTKVFSESLLCKQISTSTWYFFGTMLRLPLEKEKTFWKNIYHNFVIYAVLCKVCWIAYNSMDKWNIPLDFIH